MLSGFPLSYLEASMLPVETAPYLNSEFFEPVALSDKEMEIEQIVGCNRRTDAAFCQFERQTPNLHAYAARDQ